MLWVLVVDVGFEQGDGIEVERGGIRLADENPDEVGDLKIAGACSVANVLKAHGGEVAKFFAEVADQRGTCRGDEFSGHGGAGDGETFENGGGGGCGQGDGSVGTLNEATTEWQGAADEALDAKGFDTNHGAGDVDDGIFTSHLVEVDFFDGHVVDSRFFGGDDADHCNGVGLDRIAQGAVADDAFDLGQGTGMRLRPDDDLDLGGGEAVFVDLLDLEFPVGDGEFGKLGAKVIGVQSGIDEGA